MEARHSTNPVKRLMAGSISRRVSPDRPLLAGFGSVHPQAFCQISVFSAGAYLYARLKKSMTAQSPVFGRSIGFRRPRFPYPSICFERGYGGKGVLV